MKAPSLIPICWINCVETTKTRETQHLEEGDWKGSRVVQAEERISAFGLQPWLLIMKKKKKHFCFFGVIGGHAVPHQSCSNFLSSPYAFSDSVANDTVGQLQMLQETSQSATSIVQVGFK